MDGKQLIKLVKTNERMSLTYFKYATTHQCWHIGLYTYYNTFRGGSAGVPIYYDGFWR